MSHFGNGFAKVGESLVGVGEGVAADGEGADAVGEGVAGAFHLTLMLDMPELGVMLAGVSQNTL